LGWLRATSLLVAHFALQNTVSNSAKKRSVPERIQKADSPAVLLVQSRTPHKSFLFLLEEKNRRAQIKNCEENFLRDGGVLGALFELFYKKIFKISKIIFARLFSPLHTNADSESRDDQGLK